MKSAKNIFQPSRTPLRVAALVLSDCNTLSFAAAIDPMRAANRLGPTKSFEWHYVTATDSPVGETDTQTVTITITGTNDAPDITVDGAAGDTDAAPLTETDAGLTADGTLSVSDLDVTDTVAPSVPTRSSLPATIFAVVNTASVLASSA